jgi:putative tryptophan/tyrosine transport system substrate-binding protein
VVQRLSLDVQPPFDFAHLKHLISDFQRRENVEVGGLFSYGGNLPDQFKYAASYVDRILKGAQRP